MGSACSCIAGASRDPAVARAARSGDQQADYQVVKLEQTSDVEVLLARAQRELEQSALLGKFTKVRCDVVHQAMGRLLKACCLLDWLSGAQAASLLPEAYPRLVCSPAGFNLKSV